MKPLTIEELKALEVGDWVWTIDLNDGESQYRKFLYAENNRVVFEKSMLNMDFYETDWLAYKNKEQAEAKGEIVELPCIAMIEQGLVDGKMKQTQEAQGFNGRFAVVYMDKTKYKKPLIDVCWSKESKFKYSEAERRLAELKGEVLQ